jgi:hypothetical protein
MAVLAFLLVARLATLGRANPNPPLHFQGKCPLSCCPKEEDEFPS